MIYETQVAKIKNILKFLQTLLSLYEQVQFYQRINIKGEFDPLFDAWKKNE